MKQYFVVFSKDSYLLARLCVDLQMNGYAFRDRWHANPFEELDTWIMVNRPDWGDKNIFDIYNIPGHDFNPIRLWATEQNYLSVLTKIIEG